ncbi:LamG-like jellyroll fold domain-containing protein [Flavobacterium sp. 7A]|uniref:LamG-like jellyroll fold domain-containing protein n=1 Tax=Flavobacterium sp. 7A TaxID=2940571 RepID=UPI00222634D6|nr:LamG-like jellyroll fold domain-containing protein [Flavobacterium sp. 7A]MCW2118162.1 hypothetical protein [Flavobacterium sp. 7A]
MKQNYFLITFFLLIFNQGYCTYYFQISSLDPLNGGQTYELNQAANNLSFNINYLGCGTSKPQVATQYTLTWYVNTVNSTVGGTALSSSNQTTVAQYNLADIKTLTPNTTQVGTYYYYAIVSNPSMSTCGFSGSLATTIQRVDVTQPATHLNFDGVNDYVNINNSSSLQFGTNDVTLEATIKLDGLQKNFSGLISKANNSGLFTGFQWVVNGDQLYIEFGQNAVVFGSGTTHLNDNLWHHVACVINRTSSTISFYVDGKLDGTTSFSSSYNITSTRPLLIGTSRLTDVFFKGNIDEVRIWNTARTIEQLNASKNCELQGNEAGLVSYYKFDQGINAENNTGNTTLIDATTTGNTGTLTNFALTGTTSNWLAGSPVITGSIIPSSPTVTTPITYNKGATATALTATTGTNGTGLLWYIVATGGSGSTTATTPSTATAGSTSYWVSSTNANGCESARTEIIVKINAAATHLNFDGVNDYAEIPAGINISNSSFTIEFYVKRTLSNTNDYVFNQGYYYTNNNLHIGFRDNNNFLFAFYNNDLNVSDVNYISDNAWHQWTCVYNITTGSREVYQDGILVGSQTGVAPYTGNGSLQIGSQGNYQHFYDGSIDDIRIWNTARTAEQINATKNCELQGNEVGLVSYYKFNQGIDSANNAGITTLTDATAHANNGTISNFALAGATSNWLAGSPIITGVTCSTLSTKSFTKSNSIKVFPNPTRNNVTIEASTMENATIQVSDIAGRTFISKNISETSNTIDLSQLQQGVYIFKVKTKDGESVTKVVKQ